MIIRELLNYLNSKSYSVEAFDMTGDNSSCLTLKGGPAEKSGARNPVTVFHVSLFIRGKHFDETFCRAEALYKELHFPAVLKTIKTTTYQIFSSRCLSLPAYTGKDKLGRHLFVFDAYIKAYKNNVN